MKTLTFSLAMALSLALVTSAGAQDKCGGAKMKAAGKKAAGQTACYAKALAKSSTTLLQPCLDKVGAKFATAFSKAEQHPPCLTQMDAGAVEAVVDMCTQEIFEALRNNCSDGIVQPNEQCDDGNFVSGDGCSAFCATEHGYTCTGEPSACTTTCGDGLVANVEACDDGNTVDGDGCSATCAVEHGYSCVGSPSACATTCGDGLVAASEPCDDANTTDGDGCSSTCQVEAGFTCSGEPSICM